MPPISASLRKAAVLISALDDDSAEAVLRQMSADDAAKVRSTLVELDPVSADEQQQVLAEFLGRQSAQSSAPPTDDEVALELNPDVEAAAGVSSPTFGEASANRSPPPANPFAFLEHVDPQAIADVLGREHPQTAAVVVAQLSPRHAAAVLQQLTAEQATEALERIAWLDALTPEVQADLAAELHRQLESHISAPAADSESMAQLSAVIAAMDFRQRQRLLLQLGKRNTALANRLGLFPAGEPGSSGATRIGALRYRLESADSRHHVAASALSRVAEADADPCWLTFDDLLVLNDDALRSVFAAADADVVLLALTGAEPRLAARILKKLPGPEAAILRQRLEHPGPVRLRDIEQARGALAAIASRLAAEGTIRIPRHVRFAAAV
jgi:flagellar motor switch protein FliG